MRGWCDFPVLLCLVAGLWTFPEARAAEPTCDPLAIDLALTPQRTPNYPSLKETLILQAARPERADVVLIGDSLFAGWRTDLPTTFPTTAIYDFAVGGDRVPNVLWRLENTDLSPLRPTAIGLLIGTNDLAAGTPACAVAIGIETIVAKLRVLWPEASVLVMTIPPRGDDFHALDDQRLEVNRTILSLGRRFDKVYPATIDDETFTCGEHGKPPLAEGAATKRHFCDNYADDNLHFSTKGYAELGRVLAHTAAGTGGETIFR